MILLKASQKIITPQMGNYPNFMSQLKQYLRITQK